MGLNLAESSDSEGGKNNRALVLFKECGYRLRGAWDKPLDRPPHVQDLLIAAFLRETHQSALDQLKLMGEIVGTLCLEHFRGSFVIEVWFCANENPKNLQNVYRSAQ